MGPGRPKGSKNRAVSQSRTRTPGESMEVDSPAPVPAATVPAKRPRQATLSFEVDGQGGGAA
jgi:hypothetical protein